MAAQCWKCIKILKSAYLQYKGSGNSVCYKDLDQVLALTWCTEPPVVPDRLLSGAGMIFILEAERTWITAEKALVTEEVEEQEQTTVLEQLRSRPYGCGMSWDHIPKTCLGTVPRNSLERKWH